jgi:hypothetical protein
MTKVNVDNVERLIHEGNVRRVVIKQDENTVAEFPLTVGVIGLVLAPVLAVVGALAAVMSDSTIEVEREETPSTSRQDTVASPDDIPQI